MVKYYKKNCIEVSNLSLNFLILISCKYIRHISTIGFRKPENYNLYNKLNGIRAENDISNYDKPNVL